MIQLICHLWGDYILQSSWMALNKSKRWWPCLIHCFTYTLPFLVMTRSWKALLVIGVTHLLIDRFGLARYLVWLKESQAPSGGLPWRHCTLTGYWDPEKKPEAASKEQDVEWWLQDQVLTKRGLFVERPIWLRVWLTIVADNTVHLTINALALAFL